MGETKRQESAATMNPEMEAQRLYSRNEKVRNYWKKKYSALGKAKKSNLRKQVADKRLRIGGRFVTKE